MTSLKLFLYRAKNRLFSRRAWVVLFRSVEPSISTVVPEGIEIRKANENDIAAIANALPDELAGRLSREKRLTIVRNRFRMETPCILALESGSGQVVGGCWCRKLGAGSVLWQLISRRDAVFEISTLFVDPACRGKNLGAVLVGSASNMMRANDFKGCVSLVWYTRPASIKAHLKVGFHPIGEKNTYSILGVRWTKTSATIKKAKMPALRGAT